jgi:putative CocE/NonD family hydrolase
MNLARLGRPLLILSSLLARAAGAQTPPITPDITGKYDVSTEAYDYTKRVVMIPMRDGVKLHTVIVIPKNAKSSPMLLTRTPYNADKRAERNVSPHMASLLPQGDELFVADGYIRVFQDVRGKYGSEGDYVMTRPPRGPLNDTQVDHSTDAWDTIDWLVKNVPETNGRVGMIGSSYEGFTVVMALLDPHPALKVAAPECPMVDGWMGDDWFHYGAFRQPSLDYIVGQTSARGGGQGLLHGGADDYENFLRAGSAGDFARAAGMDQLPCWRKLSEHPAYDAFWQGQALDKLIADKPLKVPTMWTGALWDQEDMWGAIHCYEALEPKDTNNDMNFLVLGPWRHSQVNYDAATLGPMKWNCDTALQFRREVLKPFFDQHLKDNAPAAATPPVFIYNTGEDRWDRLKAWPPTVSASQTVTHKSLFLQPGFKLGFTAPETSSDNFDEYVSDPAKPVPYLPRPVRFSDGAAWKTWLLSDQRFVSDRTDVLVYTTEPLTEPMQIAGQPIVNLVASTSGTDSDWVVKLIDVYPDDVPSQPEMNAYQLPIGMDIFRGRYRQSFEHPEALSPNQPLTFKFALPTANHVFHPGHRVMIQIQSSWFPLYDRNPQTFVPNIFFAKPADYVKATQRIYHAPDQATFLDLPVLGSR